METKFEITREQLGKIHDISCPLWRDKILTITKEVLGVFKKSGELENKVVTEMFDAANSEQKKILKEIFPKYCDKKWYEEFTLWTDIVEAAKKKGINTIPPYIYPKNKREISINALFKIQTISEFFNEGWDTEFNTGSTKNYFPYFKKAFGSWVFYSVYCFYGCSDLGFGCYFKDERIATHVGKTFPDIYKEYLPE